MTAAIPFLLVFITGLGAGVYSMLEGVTPGPAARRTTRFGMISAPSVSAFAIVFGAVGYLCVTRTSLSNAAMLAIALASGLATIALSAPLTAMLARARRAIAGTESEIQGQLATVSKPITQKQAGEIIFERNGQKIRSRAIHIRDDDLPTGQDVVIERIENGTAYVEDWAAVERRL